MRVEPFYRTIAAGHMGPALRPFNVPSAFTVRGVEDAAPYEMQDQQQTRGGFLGFFVVG